MTNLPGRVVQSHSRIRRLWAGWKAVARKIGDVQSRLLLSVVYFSVIAPFGLAVRVTADPLAIKPGTPKGWRVRTAGQDASRERALQQF